MSRFTIPLTPVTKKNSQQIWYKGKRCPVCKKGAHPFPAPSEAYRRYAEEAVWHCKSLGIDYPVNVKALYYMPTRRVVDLVNLHEALHDVMKEAGTVKDDNSKIIVSTDGSRVLFDKQNPRTEVTITKYPNIDIEKEVGE